ncbi:MAG: hypothetical protein RMA76_32980 [Deltaproteobacteria bacterium]|jgi:hypothetical protein
MASSTLLGRGLSERFLIDLTRGDLEPLLESVKARRLDLQIRGGYLNVYDGRASLLKLEETPAGYRATIHHKYEPGDLASDGSGDYRTRTIPADEAARWANDFAQTLPRLQEQAAEFDKDEGRDEFEIAMANRAPPIVVIDRQTRLSGHRRSQMDLYAAAIEGDVVTLLLVELKRQAAANPTDVYAAVKQIADYAELHAPGGHLREDIATSLETIAEQRARLGLIEPLPADTRLASVPIRAVVAIELPAAERFTPPDVVAQPQEVWFARVDQETHRFQPTSAWYRCAPAAGR